MKVEFMAALAALAMSVSAQTPVPASVQQSVLNVLATAIPSESVQFAISSQSAFAAQIASSMSAGHTPSWYLALPSDVKSLLPIIYKVQATPTPSSSVMSASAAAVTSKASKASKTAAPGTTSASRASSGSSSVTLPSATVSYSSMLSQTSSAPPSPAKTSNAAALPQVAVGAGVGAALGFVGMFAL